VAQEKRHLTTEQLSILLDGEVTAEEQAQWEAHLSTCPQCQQEQAGLRETVRLLHALPPPPLPRSFMLPMEAAAPVAGFMAAPASSTAPTPIPIRRQTQRRPLNPYVRGVLRGVSTLAAIIGVVFFLSGVLPALVMHSNTSTSTAGSSTSSSSVTGPRVDAPPVNGARKTPAAATSVQQAGAPIPTPTATATPSQVLQQQPSGGQSLSSGSQGGSSSGPTLLIFDLSSPATRVGLGMALVILGLMGFVLFKRARPRTGI
jgi:anti-sigma factor RsiW